MPTVSNIDALLAALPRGRTLLALDVSKRHLGLAGCDVTLRLATALVTLPRKGLVRDLDRIAALAGERDVGGLVVGLPLNMDGSEGPRCQAVRAFGRDLDKRLGLPLLYRDERLTTFAVDDAIAEGRLPRPKRGERTDHFAACVILDDLLSDVVRP